MKKWIVLIVIAVVGFGAVSWGIGRYNTFVTQRQQVERSWAQVETQLQRRIDLIPNLINIVQGYAVHEREIFDRFADARKQWSQTAADPNAPLEAKVEAARQMTGLINNIMAVVERYPDLKANQLFIGAMDSLEGTENRIAVERKRFNEAVQTYNTFAQRFPNNTLASVFHFPAERPYYKADEGAAKAPKIEFPAIGGGTTGAVPPAPQPQPAPSTP